MSMFRGETGSGAGHGGEVKRVVGQAVPGQERGRGILRGMTRLARRGRRTTGGGENQQQASTGDRSLPAGVRQLTEAERQAAKERSDAAVNRMLSVLPIEHRDEGEITADGGTIIRRGTPDSLGLTYYPSSGEKV